MVVDLKVILKRILVVELGDATILKHQMRKVRVDFTLDNDWFGVSKSEMDYTITGKDAGRSCKNHIQSKTI